MESSEDIIDLTKGYEFYIEQLNATKKTNRQKKLDNTVYITVDPGYSNSFCITKSYPAKKKCVYYDVWDLGKNDSDSKFIISNLLDQLKKNKNKYFDDPCAKVIIEDQFQNNRLLSTQYCLQTYLELNGIDYETVRPTKWQSIFPFIYNSKKWKPPYSCKYELPGKIKKLSKNMRRYYRKKNSAEYSKIIFKLSKKNHHLADTLMIAASDYCKKKIYLVKIMFHYKIHFLIHIIFII